MADDSFVAKPIGSATEPDVAAGPVSIDFIGVGDYPCLADDWRRLEAESDGSPFTSWEWVSTWLQLLPSGIRPMVFRASDRHGAVALGLLVDVRERGMRRAFARYSIHMQETDDPIVDEITVEYTGLLARKGCEVAAYTALFGALASRQRDWRRIRFSATGHVATIEAALPASMRGYCVRSCPSYIVDLAALRASGKCYPQCLSGNARSALGRVRRAYEGFGALRVEVAGDPELAREWLDGMRTLHERYWRSKGQGGSFASGFFRDFHGSLVASGTRSGFAQLMRVAAGDLLVGYLYMLGWRNRLYYYNSGLNYGALHHHDSPGMAAFQVVIEQAGQQGWESFDFLAGSQEYKRRLSTGRRMLDWIDVRPAGPALAGEKIARRLLRRATMGTPLSDVLAARKHGSGDTP